MRTSFIETSSRKDAKECCPWAAKVVRVVGGYMCFESHEDYKTWKNQK